MTAQNIIDLTKPMINGLSIKDDTSTLLLFLNLAKNQLAVDALLWVDGEEIVMTTKNEYTLSKVPIQILDVYDSNLTVRPKGSPNYYGYYKTGPKTIRVNNPSANDILYVNYYTSPNDYVLTDEVVIPDGLINAMSYFIAHKAFESQRAEKEIVSADNHFKKYNAALNRFLSKTDDSNDAVNSVDRIKEKGLV